MKISSKGYYALIAIIYMKYYQINNQKITVNFLSKKMDITKVYLEQIFSILKKNNIISSIKGNKGGYILTENDSLSLYDILRLTDNGFDNIFFEYKDYSNLTPIIRNELNTIYDNNIKYFQNVIIDNLFQKYLSLINDNESMYYI